MKANKSSLPIRMAAAIWIIVSLPGLSAAEETEPSDFVRTFLQWYLPDAFVKGGDIIEDRRMEKFIHPTTLKNWRKENKTEFGLGYVPFVGQDYVESWAKNFQIESVSVRGDKAEVVALYPAPEWTVRMGISLLKTKDGWRIVSENPVER